MTDEKPPTETKFRISWLAFMPLLGITGYGFAYMIGTVYHQTYLHHFNVPIDLFPTTSTETFIHAYIAVLNVGLSWFSVLLDVETWFYTFFVVAVFLLEFVLLFKIPQRLGRVAIPRWLESRFYLKLGLALSGLALTICILLLAVPVVINGFLIVPAKIGLEGAKHSIEQDTRTYAQPCEKAEGERCIRLMDAGQEIARGYVVVSSGQRIALALGSHVSILPLKDYTLETITPDRGSPGNAVGIPPAPPPDPR